MYTLFYQQIFEDIMKNRDKDQKFSFFNLFKYIDPTKSPYFSEYGRDYFIPENYLIFD